jgi:BirA family biotin operon repressor/biotin-[acetyl-CoA-carboxylase] ligase
LKIIKLNATDSTNSHLKQLAKERMPEDGTLVLAKKQLSGRGQMGNGWISKEGQSFTFSMLKQFDDLSAERQFAISMAVSLGIADTLKNLNIPNISIKWPNDILSAKKKVCGILIENVLVRASVRYAVIGIGLNVNESEFKALPQASSLLLETGRVFILDEVFQIIAETVFKNLQNLKDQDFLSLKDSYEKQLFGKDVVSVFENPEGIRFNGIIRGISKIGELLVETEDGSERKFQLKEVKLIY